MIALLNRLPMLYLAYLCILPAQAAFFVEAEKTSLTLSLGQPLHYTLNYFTESPTPNQTAGLSLRIHYDSKALLPQHINAYQEGFQPPGEPMADNDDLDNDLQTDSFFIVSWIDINARWPSAPQPFQLLQMQFSVIDDFVGNSSIKVSVAALADNNEDFVTTPVQFSTQSSEQQMISNTQNEKYIAQAIPVSDEWMLLLLSVSLVLGAYIFDCKHRLMQLGKTL